VGLKRPGREADHSPPPGAEVKNGWSCTSIPTYAFMAWRLIKYLTRGHLQIASIRFRHFKEALLTTGYTETNDEVCK